MALTAARYLDMSQAGHQLTLPAAGADTFNKGAACVYSGGKVALKGAADGNIPFAGFVEHDVVASAEDDPVRLRKPARVWIPHSTAAVANRGQVVDLTSDDEAVTTAAVGRTIGTNDTPLGLCTDVVVGDGASLLVEVGRYS